MAIRANDPAWTATRWMVPTRQSSADQLNSANIFVRQQPWYRQFFQSIGQSPNQVKLSDGQRQMLQQVAARNGFDLSNTDGMNFDPSGNVAYPHGWASQPTWAKGLEIAAPIAATVALTGGAGIPGVTGLFGGGAPAAAGTTAATAGTAAATTGTVAGTAGAAGAGLSLSNYLTRAIPSLVQAGVGIYSTNRQASANQAAINAQTQANAAALEYTKQKDAQDRADFLNAQRANYAQYVAREQRFAPYRASGEAANMTIAHLLGLPSVNVAQPPPLPSYLQDNTMSPLVGGR